jgi:hypothetical protein
LRAAARVLASILKASVGRVDTREHFRFQRIKTKYAAKMAEEVKTATFLLGVKRGGKNIGLE